jgi:hypothetical protein
VDPNIPETAGIVAKVLRSLKPEAGKSDIDKLARAAKATKFSAGLIPGESIDPRTVYPGLGERWGRSPESGIGVVISKKSVRRLAEKIVKGIYFLQHGKLIDHTYSITFIERQDSDWERVSEPIERHGKEYARGVGIVVRQAIAEDEPMCSLLKISIWGEFKMYAVVLPRGE